MTSQLSAIELLELGNEGRTKPWLNRYWSEILGVSFGLATGVMLNFATRRPVFSGIQKHALAIVGWTSVLTYVQNLRDDYLAEKDAVLRHYISLHPEDFTEPKKQKIGDIFEPWFPIR